MSLAQPLCPKAGTHGCSSCELRQEPFPSSALCYLSLQPLALINLWSRDLVVFHQEITACEGPLVPAIF